MSLSNIIKYLTVWELWPAQDFGFRGDNYIMKKVRIDSIAQDLFWLLSVPLPNIINISQTIRKLWSAQEFGLEICSEEITRKGREQKLSFLHAIVLLDLIYVPIK